MATSTRKTYRAGIRKFVKFCDQHHACPLPVQKETVAYFAVAMTRELTPSTISVYLSAVTVMHRIAGFSDPTRHNYLLKLVLKGAKRIHSLQPTRKREPITDSTNSSQVTLPDSAYTVTSKERSAYAGSCIYPYILWATTSE